MQFPKNFMRAQTVGADGETERQSFMFLRTWFRDLMTYTISGVQYLLFGKTSPNGTDPWQFKDSIQIWKQSQFNAPGAELNTYRTRGTTTPAAVQIGDYIGTWNSYAYNGTSYIPTGTIACVASQTWSLGATGSGYVFAVTPNGTSVPISAFSLQHNGNVVVGSALATNATVGFLHIPTCAGVPTGAPTPVAGVAPLIIDSTNRKMYFYDFGTVAWIILN